MRMYHDALAQSRNNLQVFEHRVTTDAYHVAGVDKQNIVLTQ